MDPASEVSRSGRVRKKSSKLLSIEQETVNEQKLLLESHSSSSNSKAGNSKNKSKYKELPSQPTETNVENETSIPAPSKKSSKLTVPKLRIKLGSVPSLSLATPKEPGSKSGKRSPGTSADEPKRKKSKIKTNEKSATVKNKPAKRTKKLQSSAAKKESATKVKSQICEPSTESTNNIEIPQDIDVEIPKKSEYQQPGAEDSVENCKAEDRTENISQSPLSPEASTFGVAGSGKRQRKPPAKLKEDYVDLDSQANKAAKFFKAKKAEKKAAVAIAKHEASKSGKKRRNRMPTAYTMWCNSYRAKLQVQSPGMDFASMNKKLGEVWWSIPLKEKNAWKRKAKRLATHGFSQKNSEVLNYVGSKAMLAIRKKIIGETGAPPPSMPAVPPIKVKGTPVKQDASYTYKITQTEPVDVAAHFELMSESLSTIAAGLQQSAHTQVQGTLSMLLDALLCGMSSLMCLTQQVPELDDDIDPETHKKRMADIAHYIPDI